MNGSADQGVQINDSCELTCMSYSITVQVPRMGKLNATALNGIR